MINPSTPTQSPEQIYADLTDEGKAFVQTQSAQEAQAQQNFQSAIASGATPTPEEIYASLSDEGKAFVQAQSAAQQNLQQQGIGGAPPPPDSQGIDPYAAGYNPYLDPNMFL